MSLWFLKDICNISIIRDIDRIARINPDLACCDHFYALKYADLVLRDRFPLGEPIIATNTKSSYWYARSVLKGRFPLGEPIIAKDTLYAKAYSYDVLKHDFYIDGKLICEYET